MQELNEKSVNCGICGSDRHTDAEHNSYLARNYNAKVNEVIPPKYWHIESDRDYLKGDIVDGSVFISGDVGRGKTVLLASIVKRILKEKTSRVKWISYPEFIITLQNLYKAEHPAVAPDEYIKDIAYYTGVLVIDDLGAEKITDFVRQTTYFILNHREQYMLQTLITSNWNLDKIDGQIDSRVSSRITGMCDCIILTGKDRRLAGATKT